LNSAKNTSSIREPVPTRAVERIGCSGTLLVRMDSAFYCAPAVWAARRAGARFSVTVRLDPKVRTAIAAIPENAWAPIRYPQAIWDDQLGRWVSDAEIAEVAYTAFTSRKGQAMTAHLLVHRVKDLNRKAAPGQGELFTAWRYHALFRVPGDEHVSGACTGACRPPPRNGQLRPPGCRAAARTITRCGVLAGQCAGGCGIRAPDERPVNCAGFRLASAELQGRRPGTGPAHP
jgi:hypothetical protein